MARIDAEVIIVGAGATGSMLACELGLAGVRALVLERQPRIGQVPKAYGLGGQILRLLHYRGLLDRFEAAAPQRAHPAMRYPFGGLHLDFTHVPNPPLRGIGVPQWRTEELLDEYARELGAQVRRGHAVIGLSQDEDSVTAQVRGPDGEYRVTGRYLVGCDGAHSRVRELAGIAFPGTTYPEINRLAEITVPASALVDGALDVPGFGSVEPGFTRTERGVFAWGPFSTGTLLVQTTEYVRGESDDDQAPMTLAEFQDSVRTILGAPLPVRSTVRLSRYAFQGRQADPYLLGRIMVAGDAAHQFPSTGVGLSAGMLDAVNLAWKLAADLHGHAPADLLASYAAERRFANARTLMQTEAQVALRRGEDAAADALRTLFAELVTDEPTVRRLGALVAGADLHYPLPNPNDHELTGTFAPDLPLHTDTGSTTVADLMHPARPVLLDLADRADLRDTARDWSAQLLVCTAKTDDRPADALLIRPDAYVVWAAHPGEPTGTAAPALRAALERWLGPR